MLNKNNICTYKSLAILHKIDFLSIFETLNKQPVNELNSNKCTPPSILTCALGASHLYRLRVLLLEPFPP